MKRFVIALLACLLLLAPGAGAVHAEEPELPVSGEFSVPDGILSWELSAEDSALLLTLSGSGTVPGPDAAQDALPWLARADELSGILIEEGITALGSGAFGGCSALESVTLPESLNAIGAGAIPAGTAILGWAETAAETYAAENGCPFTDVSSRYSIEFRANGATGGSMASLNGLSTHLSHALPANAFTRKGWSFSGWNTAADGSGTAYAKDAVIPGHSYDGDTVLTLYAQWSEHHYTVKFSANGASGTMASKTCLYSGKYTLPACKFTKKGYAFTGWNTKKDGSGTAYADRQSFSKLKSTDGASLTLYAQWELKQYTVSYVLDGGKNSRSNPASYTVLTDTFSLKAPSRTGYTFLGWYKDSAYKTARTEIKKGSVGAVTVYAKWQEHKYSISFDGNGADSGSLSRLSCRYSRTYTLPANPYKKSCYSFTGWNTRADGSGKAYADGAAVKSLSSKDGGKITLYAQWRLNQYTVRFRPNGGSGSMEDQVCSYSGTYTLRANSYSLRGYRFTGWNTKADGSGKAYAAGAKILNLSKKDGAKITLYAQWELKKYSISYKLAGGKNSSSNPASYTVLSDTVTFKAPKHPDGNFLGWYKDAAFTKPVTQIKAGSVGSLTLYARWEILAVSTGIDQNVCARGEYSNWEGVSNVAQFTDQNGLYCFAYPSGKYVNVCRCSDGAVSATLRLKLVHPIFGDVTCDANGNFYVVSAKENTSGAPASCIYITKYDSSGAVIKTVGNKGDSSLAWYYTADTDDFYTRLPFEGGSCDAAVNGNLLSVHYAREMLSGHQSNSVWTVNIKTMKTVAQPGAIYSSHSFAQRAVPCGEGFLYVSEGDAYNRAFTVTRTENGLIEEADIFHFWLPRGADEMLVVNNNFAHLGDLVMLPEGCAALVGTSAPSLSSAAETESEQIFIQIFRPEGDLSSPEGYVTAGTRSGLSGRDGTEEVTDHGVKWLTSGNTREYKHVQAVAAEDGRIVILFEQYTKDGYVRNFDGVYYMILNSSGSVLTSRTLFLKNARLNPCRTPVYRDGTVCWTANRYNWNDYGDLMYDYCLKLK